MRSSGKVDAVYDIDGSVGVFLTVEEHGLKLLGEGMRGGWLLEHRQLQRTALQEAWR